MFKSGELSAKEAETLNRLLLDVRYIKSLKVAAPLRIRRDPAGMCIEQIFPEENPRNEGSGSGADAGGDDDGVRCSGTVSSRPIFTKQSCIEDKVYRYYQLETWSYDSNGCLQVTRGDEYGEETEECCTSVECPDGGSGNPPDTVIISCCVPPVPRTLLAEVVSDCGNFNITLEFQTPTLPNIYTWTGSGNCSMCAEDGCGDATDPCWTLVAENQGGESCSWTLFNCNAAITFGGLTFDCDPFLITMLNENPFPCECADGTTVTVTPA
jgi:hypothetical protein